MATLWPECCRAIVSVSGYLISTPAGNREPWPPDPAFLLWHQYYFATPVGKAGYAKYLDQFNKFIWHQASPKWNFDDARYNRAAASFNNPDHVDIVMHVGCMLFSNLQPVSHGTQNAWPADIIWQSFNNEYWPADYFIDGKGRIRYHHFGEGDYAESERVIQGRLVWRAASFSPRTEGLRFDSIAATCTWC